jgi:hypothetical protein
MANISRLKDATWRCCNDVNFSWVALGLVAGPLVPFGILASPALFLGWPFLFAVCAIGVALVTWSLLTGFAYLSVISRVRGGIGRRESILLGVGSASLTPIAAYAACGALGDATESLRIVGADLSFSLAMTLALLFLPLGVLAGWIFWNIGVKPEMDHVKGVFD